MRPSTYLAALSCAAAFSLPATTEASITINLYAGELRNASGSASIAQGTLLQLINLGSDGIFNEINVGDTSSTGLARWTSGDDSVLDAVYLVGNGPGDFASTAAFDLSVGSDPTTGIMERSMKIDFSSLPAGTKLGIRWFPGLAAADFQTITLAQGQSFGQFTRQTAPMHSGSPWVTGADGSTLGFDALATANIGGGDANSAGFASFTVVPEPASIALSMIGAAGLAFMRRRRA